MATTANASRPDSAGAVARVSELWPDWKPTDQQRNAWLRMFDRYNGDLAKQAVADAFEKSTGTTPTIGSVRYELERLRDWQAEHLRSGGSKAAEEKVRKREEDRANADADHAMMLGTLSRLPLAHLLACLHEAANELDHPQLVEKYEERPVGEWSRYAVGIAFAVFRRRRPALPAATPKLFTEASE